ncbi:unnamed protein product [Oncorhynchus mykiss]|uniref:Prenyltransferase alpha-alpha toroid domain-containing protein n=1 Tax=Oncorhynchus mykiss TaxID=8022 RepID=A0A060ZHK9_ONCMY|nr:unnamed protein product [Oncorhynchus mykiss]
MFPIIVPPTELINMTQVRCDVVLNPPREKLLSFLFSVKQTDGSFVIHGGGEVDIRSAYCAASVAPLTNIMTPTLFQDTPTHVFPCQNWEGGLGGVPGLEAHGGYTFCGTAAVVILGKEHMLDLKTLLVNPLQRELVDGNRLVQNYCCVCVCVCVCLF